MAFEVGTDVEALCNTCGDVWHVIFVKTGDKISKVECKQCGKRHRFKASGDAPEANLKPTRKAAAKASGGSKTVRKPRREAGAALAVYDPDKPTRPYGISERFAVGEQIQHPSFGPGVVIAVEMNKVRVNFAEGLKVLRCGTA